MKSTMLSLPLTALSFVVVAAAPQVPPRDSRAARPAAETAQPAGTASAEAEWKRKIDAAPAEPGAYLALAKLQEERGAYADAEATLARAREIAPTKKEVHIALSGLYNRKGDFERTVGALEDAARLSPSDPAGYQLVATYYWEKAYKDVKLSPAQRWTYIFEGINATDRAIALNPDYAEALTYKNILLRMRANLETDPVQQKTTLAEADALRNRALALNKAKTGVSGGVNMISSSGVAVPAPPPPPPPPSGPGQAPLRVGGNIRPPTKIRHVPPVYPAVAQEAKISGIVIIEATIGADGRVADARVLKSIPELDQAAVDAVRQWQFEQTLLNGIPVPVIMTVTVNFSLM